MDLFLEDGIVPDDANETTIRPQRPRFLWIGCSDARVPESVMNLALDQIFVHRNIANQFMTGDQNARSVLTYGIKYIRHDPIQEVRVVGHTACGGVETCRNAVDDPSRIPPELREWLQPLLELARRHRGQPLLALTEENVKVQMRNVHTVLNQLGLRRQVEVKGFVYHVAERELREVRLPPLPLES